MKNTVPGILLILVLGFGCTEKSASPEYLSSFPMENGTQWVYDLVTVMQELEHEGSDRIIATDTFAQQMLSVWIAKDTVLNDTLLVKQFLSRINNEPLLMENYYRIDKNGLWVVAYRNPGVPFLKKGAALVEAPVYFSLFGSSMQANDNSLHIYDEPRLALKFPLNLGVEWNYGTEEGLIDFRLDKKVSAFESVDLGHASALAFCIDYLYPPDSFFDDFEVKDWVSEQGLIKRIDVINGVQMDFDGEFIGTYRLTNTLTLRKLELK
jgi:hypothetical protein